MTGLRTTPVTRGKALVNMKRGIALVAEQQAAKRARKPPKIVGLSGWLPDLEDPFWNAWVRLSR